MTDLKPETTTNLDTAAAWERAVRLARGDGELARPGDREDLRAALAGRLRFDECLDRITASFMEEDDETAADGLLLAEDLVQVADLLDFAADREQFLGELEAVLALTPPALAGLARLADARLDDPQGSEGLWRRVLEAQVGGRVRADSAPLVRPAASVTARVLGLRVHTLGLVKRLAALMGGPADGRPTLRAAQVQMAGPEQRERHHEVRIGATPTPPRVFLAFSDDEEPGEVPREQIAPVPEGGWSFEIALKPDESAWIVLATESRESGDSLEQLVQRAEAGDPELALRDLLITSSTPRTPSWRP